MADVNFPLAAAKLKAKYQRLEDIEHTIDTSATEEVQKKKYPSIKGVIDYVGTTAVQADWAETTTTAASFIKNKPDLTDYLVTVEKQATATSGYAATYLIKQDGNQVGDAINIPLDYLVKTAEVKTCTVADQPIAGLVVGDKYIDFTVNAKEGTGTESHIYIAVKSMVSPYTVSDTDTIDMTLSTANDISAVVKDTSITRDKIADSAVTEAKISTSAVTTDKINDGAVTTAKLADANVTTAKIADSAVTTLKIADSAITTDKYADDSITTAKISDGNITTDKLANESVTGGDATTTGKIAASTIKMYNINKADLYAAIDADLAAAIETDG